MVTVEYDILINGLCKYIDCVGLREVGGKRKPGFCTCV